MSAGLAHGPELLPRIMAGDRMTAPDDWFIPLADPDAAVTHLYALPQAGAGCTAFAECASLLAPDLALWALNLPGRQARFAEPPSTALPPLLDQVADVVGGHEPWLLFGYCSGALLAFLLARRLRAAGQPGPAGLLVASYPAPDLARPPLGLHMLPPDEFWAEIMSYGGVPASVAAQPDFREIFEPALRADYQLLAGYRYVDEPPLDVPVTVLTGDRDPVLTPEDIRGWSRHTTGPVRFRSVPGGHWLLDDALPELAGALREAAR
jgi:surfactin synthase thioesterase subunit